MGNVCDVLTFEGLTNPKNRQKEQSSFGGISFLSGFEEYLGSRQPRYTHTRIHICICVHIYIYIYKYIRHRAWRVGRERTPNSAFRRFLFDDVAFLL